MDEPDLKAKFTIRLGYKDGMTAVSNMPFRTTVPIEDPQIPAGYKMDESLFGKIFVNKYYIFDVCCKYADPSFTFAVKMRSVITK